VCWADEKGIFAVLQQSPFFLQLLDELSEVDELRYWSGDSGDTGDNSRRIGIGTWRQSDDGGGDTP
jgi:hypothetical protein